MVSGRLVRVGRLQFFLQGFRKIIGPVGAVGEFFEVEVTVFVLEVERAIEPELYKDLVFRTNGCWLDFCDLEESVLESEAVVLGEGSLRS